MQDDARLHDLAGAPEMMIDDDMAQNPEKGNSGVVAIGTVTIDRNRQIRVCDRIGAALLGSDVGHERGRSFDDFIAPADIDRFTRHLHDVANDGRTHRCELTFRSTDGRMIPVELNTGPILSPAGGVEAYCLSMTQPTPLYRALRELEETRAALADQIRDNERLHDLSMRMVASADLETLLQEIMSVAVDMTRADKGNMLLLDADSGELVLRAHQGLEGTLLNAASRFHPEVLETACGKAMTSGCRVIVPDVETSDIFAGGPVLPMLRDAGVRAMVSTPLVARSGRVLGVVTSHYIRPTTPDRWMLQRMDLLARQAADLIERVQAEKALRSSEDRLRGFFDASSVLMSVIELRGDDYAYVHPNRRLAEWFGLSPETLAGRTALSLGMPTETVSQCVEKFRRCAETREPISSEYRVPRGNGEHWFFCTMSHIGDFAGGPHFCLTLVDITEQKRAVAARTESDDRYRAFVDHATDAIILHDADGAIVDVNRQACVSLGYDRDELIGKMPYAFDPQVDLAGMESISRRLSAGETISFDSIHRRKDGSDFPVEVRIRPFHANGKQFGLSLTRDITARKQAEGELSRSEARFRGAIENIPDVIVIYDRELRIQFINAATTELTGRRPGDFIGRRDDEIWPPEVHSRYLPTLKSALQSRTIQSVETEVRFPNTGIRFLHIQCVPLLNDDGTIREIVGITHDLTARKNADRAVRESEQRFSQFMEHLPGLAWIKNAEGRYVYANRNTANHFGVTPDEIRNKLDADMIPSEIALEFLESDRHVLSSKAGVQFRECRIDESGLQRHALVSKFPIPSMDGESTLVGGVAIDITERMHAEETIRQIVDGIAPTTGQDFFRTLANHLSRVCHVDYAIVGRIDRSDPNTVHSIAVSLHGEIIDNVSYELRGKPCENVVNRGACFRVTGVQAEFPDDKMLRDLNIDSYMGAPLFSSGGELLGLVALLHSRPITHGDQAMAILRVIAARAGGELERERAQLDLDRTRLEFDFLAESFPSTVFRADDQGRFININDIRWTRLTAGEPGAWRGEGWLDAVDKEDRERVAASWREFVVTGGAWSEEFRFHRSDAGIAWVLAEAVPIKDSSGRIAEFFGAFVDITHLIETKQALRLTQFSVDQASIAIFWIDRSSRIRYVNEWACIAVGYSRDELLNMSMIDLTPHSVESWNTRFDRVKEKGSARFESRQWRKDGSSFPIDVAVNYVRFGGEDFLFAFAQDISERKQVEDRLEQQNAELAHVSRLSTMGQMVATLSHELSQPLSAVANYSSACTAHLKNARTHDSILAEYLDGISRQTTRAGEILRRVRDFVRNTVPRKAVFDLNLLLEDSMALMSNDYGRHQIKLTSELRNSPLRAVVDRVQFQQVIVNLLANARDAVSDLPPPVRCVIVRSYADGGSVTLEVEDSGAGLSDEIGERIFEPFVTTKENGMGIGLSICKSIVESHEGRISHGIGHSGGAFFRIVLPLVEGAESEQ